ncbi:hypothetical protein BUALT_Bualt13G0032800 [Buddleja alternifolia]|uniref:Zinc finger A20 and AN1 domain-containing stress-associated protein 8 n=1 Tax=Buddleja alternifolia TaxID=168488 RepID=A0AAV6WVB4_9LAMI|nr:hypothetical protein BUALT_Bualt13G0032800 [Buddleja alternifolia]
MEHDETGCQSPLEGPVLCVNNCGFFGSSSSMNMCSKCYKDLMLKQQAKFAASSIENIVNGSSSGTEKESIVTETGKSQTELAEVKSISLPSMTGSSSDEAGEAKTKAGPNRCSSCKKRVGLTGFECRCGSLFCGSHRYSDKHDCPFDYRTAGRDAIAKANPVVKAEKLDKI